MFLRMKRDFFIDGFVIAPLHYVTTYRPRFAALGFHSIYLFELAIRVHLLSCASLGAGVTAVSS